MDVREIVQKEIEKLEKDVVRLIKNRTERITENVDAMTKGLNALENLKNVSLVIAGEFDHIKHSTTGIHNTFLDLERRICEIFEDFESGRYRIIVAIMRIR